MIPSTLPQKTLRFEGNKINCFLKDQSFCDLYIAGNFWKLEFIKPPCNRDKWSTLAGNSALLPSDVIDFAMLPTQRFWGETVSLLDVM